MLILVFGIPGVGKTTVLEELKKIKPHLVVKKFGTIEFEIAQKKGLVNDRDELRKLDIEIQKSLQFEALDEINRLHDEFSDLVIDTHAAVKTKAGYWPGFSESLLKKIFPDIYVLVECAHETILRHRLADVTRTRDDESLADIEQHQMIDRAFAATYATMTNGMILIVDNKEGEPQFAAQKIAKVLE